MHPSRLVEARIEDVNLQGMTELHQQQRIEDRFKEQQEQLDAVLKTVTRHAEDLRGNSKAVAGVTAAQARAAATAAAAPQRPQQPAQQYDPDIVVIAGFKGDSPCGTLMAAWGRSRTRCGRS